MANPLSVLLREGTKDSHRAAENTPFIRNFFAGSLSIETYREFLVQLLHIYTALEAEQLRHQNHSMLRLIYFPELLRSESIRKDLEFYYGNDQWMATQPSSATQTYVDRILTLSTEWVDGLVAHLYTRYLGDLSGGQALKRIVSKTYSLPSNDGLAFYEFPQIPNHTQFKNDYRTLLDSMQVDQNIAQKIVDEANYAFKLNSNVFEAMMV